MPEEDENSNARRTATLLGRHLVGQVLQQATSIATAAQSLGWCKDPNTGRLCVAGYNDLFATLLEDNEVLNQYEGTLASSTPQKEDILNANIENSFIGQGDEGIDMVSKEEIDTYVIIEENSDVFSCEDVAYLGKEVYEEDSNQEIIKKEDQMFSIMFGIMDEIFENAFGESVEDGVQSEEKQPDDTIDFLENLFVSVTGENYENQDIQDRSLITPEKSDDKYIGEPENYINFYIETVNVSVDNKNPIKEVVQADIHGELEKFYKNEGDNFTKELIDTKEVAAQEVSENDEVENGRLERSEAARYEDAYLSLNRDYEQCSDDEKDLVLQDVQTPMQDVDLCSSIALIKDEEEENKFPDYGSGEPEGQKESAAYSAVTEVTGASSSRIVSTSLVSRCRTQGSRFLACLRGWWKRKTLGKRKVTRSGSICGMCPMSPDMRRRVSTIIDQRLCIPNDTPSVTWKFNTINESAVNSSKWKDYTFKIDPNESGEHF